MKISKLLGIDLTQPSVIATFSKANQGKSTLMAYFVKELHENNKTILILSETENSVWLTRLKNLDCLGEKPSIIYKEYYPLMGNILEFIKERKEAKPEIDCVIIDFAFSYSDRDELKKTIDYVKENNIMLFIQKQQVEQFILSFETSIELKSSDIALSIKRIPNKLSFWKRFLNAFRPIFGLEVFQEPNIKLHLLKNRFGCDNTVSEVFFDFNKINKK